MSNEIILVSKIFHYRFANFGPRRQKLIGHRNSLTHLPGQQAMEPAKKIISKN